MYFGLTKEDFEAHTLQYSNGRSTELMAIIVEKAQRSALMLYKDSLDFDTRRDKFIDVVIKFCAELNNNLPNNPQAYLMTMVKNAFLQEIEKRKKMIYSNDLPASVAVPQGLYELIDKMLALFCQNCNELLDAYYDDKAKTQEEVVAGKLPLNCIPVKKETPCACNYHLHTKPTAENVRQRMSRMKKKIKTLLQLELNQSSIHF